MKNSRKIAEAIKEHLVKMARYDEIPMDMGMLSVMDLENVINSIQDNPDQKEKAIEIAGYFLACDPDQVEAMVRLIINHPEETDFIDDIEGVDVYTKFENSFTVESFADQIGWKEEF